MITIKNRKILAAATLLLFACAFLAKIFTANIHAGEGIETAQVREKGAKLQLENARLNNEIVSVSSLTEIAEKSEDLGLVKPQNVVYITQEEKPEKLHAAKR